ncbi:hypothetical protein [Escherichia phage EP_H11]|nr:hypothetical protein [Escherichia phage EP_H11]
MKTADIITFLGNLSSLYNKVGDNRRAGSFARASQSIQLHVKIPEVKDLTQLGNLPNVGSSTINELIEMDTKGTTDRMESLKKQLEEDGPQDTSAKLASAMDTVRAMQAKMGKK